MPEREATFSPYGQHLSFDRHLSFVFYDTVVHTWDLAKAAAQPVIIGDELARRALAAVTMLSEHRDIRVAGWFAAGREVNSRRRTVDRLVAFAGRDPAWGTHSPPAKS